MQDHDDLYEGEDPPEDDDASEQDETHGYSASGRVGNRIALFFTGVSNSDSKAELEAVVEAAIEDAETRGLFFEWAAVDEMQAQDVIVGSPLHQSLTGKVPRD